MRDGLIDVYHEILMNEVGVMRGNTPIVSGFRVGDAIYYYTGFIGKTTASTPRRGLDFTLLAYAVINGLRRRYCGYDPERPSLWRSKCKCIQAIYDGIAREFGKRPRNLKELLVIIISELIDSGLIKPIPPTGIAKDTITPKRFISWEGRLVNVRDDVDLASVSTASLLLSFFSATCPEIQEWNMTDVLKAEEEILRRLGLLEVMHGLGREITMYYKTTHGELFRALANASSLPGYLANFEARVLPFLAEPPPPRAESAAIPRISVDELKEPLTRFLSTYRVRCAEEVAEAILRGLKRAHYTHLNPYQASYLKLALMKGLKNALIILTSPTGSGKTLVFTLIAIAAAVAGKLSGRAERTIITYPRKSLAREQLERLIEVVYYINEELANLNDKLGRKIEVRVAIRDGDSLSEVRSGEVKPLRGITFTDVQGRRLALCHGVDDQGNYFVELRDRGCDGQVVRPVDWVSDIKEKVRVKMGNHATPITPYIPPPDILITNNSMLSKMGFDLFSGSPWLNWLRRLKLLVIDEAHVFMDPEEMQKMFLTITRLLWKLSSSSGQGKTIEDYVKNVGLSVIISSATLTESKLFRALQETRICSQNIVGILRSPICSDKVEDLPNEVREFVRKLLSNGFYGALSDNIIYRDYYSEVVCMGKKEHGGLVRGLLKLNTFAVTLPSPERRSWTSLAESMVAVLHWVNSLRRQVGLRNAEAIIFIDNKKSQKHILKVFARRQVLEAADHADRVLMSVLYPSDTLGHARKGHKLIWRELKAMDGRTLFETAWDIGRGAPVLSTFHGLSLYHNTATIEKMVATNVVADETAMRKTFIQAFSNITEFIEGLTEYAKIFLAKAGTRRPLEAIEEAISRSIPVGFVIHNADIPNRDKVESYLRNGIPYLVMTTSTLEVGIDIPYTTLVLQYASTPTTAELIQRFGRSGRGPESLYVTTGVLILRNTGEDVHYLSDENIIDYVFGLRFPPLPDVESDVEALVRNVVSIVINTSQERMHTLDVENMAREYLQFLGINNEDILYTAADLASKAVHAARIMTAVLTHSASKRVTCVDARTKVAEALDNLRGCYTIHIDNNVVLSKNQIGRKATSLIRNFISMVVTEITNPSQNLSLAIYVAEELTGLIIELCSLLRAAPIDIQRPIAEFVSSANKVLDAIWEMVVACIHSYLESSDLSDRTAREVMTSFVHRIIRPGILNELGSISEDYGAIHYTTKNGKTTHKGGRLSSFDELLNRASPAKHGGG